MPNLPIFLEFLIKEENQYVEGTFKTEKEGKPQTNQINKAYIPKLLNKNKDTTTRNLPKKTKSNNKKIESSQEN